MFGVIQTNNETFIKKQRYVRIVGTISAFILLLLTFFAAFPVINKTMEAEAAPGTATASTSSITMTSGHTSANLNLAPHDSNGTFSSSSSSELASFGVTTNNYTGYTLSIAASDDAKKLNNNSVADASLDSITSSTDAETFSSSTSNSYKNKWGYKPSKYNSLANTNFLPSPTTTASTLDTTSAANTTANNYTIGLGARVDYTKPAGSYTNTFILTAVGNPIAYTINYLDNTGDSTVTGLPPVDSGVSATTAVTLSSTTPTRTGYTFSKWCLGTVSDNGATCTGTEYTKGASLDFIDQTTTGNIINLYAVWTADQYTITLNGNGATNTPTASTTATYGSTTLGAIATLPTRSYSYTGFTMGTGASGLTPDFTNASANCKSTTSCSNSYTFNGWYKEAAGTNKIASNAATPALSASTSYTDANSKWTSTSAQTLWAGWGSGTSITLPRISKTGYTCSWNTNSSGTGISFTSGGTYTPTANQALYGICTVNSYNVKVNFAGSGVSSVTFTATGQTSRTVTASGGTASLVYNVPYTMTMNFTDGYEFESWALNSSSYGTLSSNATNPTTFTPNQNSNSAIITATGKQSIAMQDVTFDQCTTAGLTATDTRDSKAYTIKRLGDGNCWMTQNLRFTGTSLDPSTSNVASAKTITYGDLTSGNSYDEARIHDSGNTTEGVWYNYAAASAMSITGSSNATEATESVCPKGWRLPTQAEQEGIMSYSSSFTPVAGGYYNGGSLYATSYGYWWSSTAVNNTGRYVLYYNGSSLNTNSYARNYGYYVRCIKPKPTMQDVTSADVESMSEGETMTRPDARDGQVYTMAKIDGNLWMTQNLRFTGTSLDPSTSNVASAKTITYGDLTTSGNSTDEARIHDSGNTTNGVWYNYAAASAMSITGDSNEAEASESVCPKGWRLPTNAEQAGITSYSSSFSPVAGGDYYGGSLNSTSNGHWWSSTASSNIRRYSLNYNGSSLNAGSGNRNGGLYVRCIKDKTMQGITSTEIAAMSEGETTISTDARDGQVYTMAKINGNLWMTQNLRFTGTSLDPSTSNVSSAKTITYGDLTSGNSYDQARIHDSGNTTNGVWYNYAAASAMSITGSSNATEATESVCPKGWRLPTRAEQEGITSYSSSFNPVTGGLYLNGSLSSYTSAGYWWSSTARNNTDRYYLAGGNGILGGGTHYRYAGVYVRCIKPGPPMQNITSTEIAAMSEGNTMTRPDARDGQVYTMAKINGKLWMTRNLAIGCNGSGSTYGSSVSQKTLSSADSNVSSYTTPTALLSQASSSTQTADYSNGRIQCNATYGAWYNYAAASAGTVTGNSNGTGASSSICPLGWRLPTYAEFSAITSYQTAFNPVPGGYYSNGSLYSTSFGYWWSSTADSSTSRYLLSYSGSSLSTTYDYRYSGNYVRCLHE